MKTIKIYYPVIALLYVFLTIYEVFIYMTMDSNYVGIVYLFLNLFVMFLLLTVTYNYKKASVKFRISKNIISIIIGLFSSFILPLILPSIMGYNDASKVFIDSTLISSLVLKPIIYISLSIVSFMEYKRYNLLSK